MKGIDLSLLPEKLVERLLEQEINISEISKNENTLLDGAIIMNSISPKCPFKLCDGSGWLYLKNKMVMSLHVIVIVQQA